MQRTLFIWLLMVLPLCLQGQSEELKRIDELLLDSKYDEAIRIIETSLPQSKTPTLLQLKKSEALIRLGKLSEAEALLKSLHQAVENEKERNYYRALLAMNLGALYQSQNKFDQAAQELQRSISLLEEDSRGSSLDAAEALAYLGNVFRSTGKNMQAEEILLHALTVRQQILPEAHELIAASYNDLGLVYTELDINKSFDYYEKALAIYEKLHGTEHPKIAISNTNLAYVYQREKLYGDAVNYYESALKIWEKIYTQPHPNKALVLMNLGQTYSSMGDSKAALEFFEKSRAMYEAAQGNKHPDLAYVHNVLGNEKLGLQKFDEALGHYQKALIANIPDFTNENILVNPGTKTFYNGNQLLYSLMYKAQGFETRHKGKTLKESDLVIGLRTLQTADSLIDRMRQQITNESDKITLGAIANEVYADGVRISYLLSDLAFKNRKGYRELSFYFAEKSKSAVLLEAISDTNAKSFANIPDELLEEEKNLKSAIALIAQKLAQKPAEEEEKYLRETLFSLNRGYQDFTRRLETQYPEYFNLKFNSASPSIQQLQNLLPQQTALISYFIDEKNSRLYTYTISKKSFRISDNTLPENYDKLITGFRNSLYFMEINAYKATARSLHQLLIPKNIPRNINDLVIVPTGRMSVIPFEALLTKDVGKDEEDYKKLPYLINTFSTRYEFSAGLVLQKKQDTSRQTISSVLLCAPISFPVKENLYDLPATELEVNTIARLFGEKKIESKVLLNQQATETSIKSSSLKDYSLVHFATHGIVDERSPELSRIYLQTDTEAEDGSLFAGEIYNLQLDAQLVALSACQTGLGKISKGEGVIGLSRALVYAGAKNLIVSFWSVADESTAELMMDFYKRLLEETTENYSKNLKQSKLQLLNGKYAAPYYWAPFILIGF